MALRTHNDPDSLTLIIGIDNDGTVARMRKDLDDALTLALQNSGDPDIYHVAIDMSGTWRPGDPELQPWEAPFLRAWQDVLGSPDMRRAVAEWLGRASEAIKAHYETHFSSLTEHDEVQFGEVPAVVLASTDRAYLPIFTDLLGVWDMAHSASVIELAESLIEKFGPGPDTDALAQAIEPWT